MKFKSAQIFLFLLAVGAISFGCTPKDIAFRTTGIGAMSTECGEALLVSSFDSKSNGYDETVLRGQSPARLSRLGCNISRYKVPGGSAWLQVAGGGEISRGEVDEYTLAFIEMPERDSDLLKQQQLTDLLSQLRKNRQDGKQNVVSVYVHGWRHDAALGNGNVIRFRTMLGYTRSALNARCAQTKEYCNAALTGVYLSWRGRSFQEPVKANAAGPWLVGGLWTNWARKAQSEKLAHPKVRENTARPCGAPAYGARENSSIIGGPLRSIEKALSLKHGSTKSDKMLVVGHSYGANMLAHYLRPTAVDQVECHETGSEMKPILGDLVVLLNPASEAKNWTDIQYAMRQKVGIPEDVYNVDSVAGLTPEVASSVKRWKAMFPRTQRPFYVAITATADWGRVEKGKANPDNATRLAFPLSRSVVGQTSREQRIAIGHLLPNYPRVGSGWLRPVGPPVGASHEFIVNKGIKRGTSYNNSGNPKLTACGAHTGWLYEAQKRKGFKGGWDSGHTDAQNASRLNNMGKAADGSKGKPELQIRNVLQPTGGSFAYSVAQATSPFWNMRAWQTAVYDHAGFINYVTLCGINLLWLDDATLGAE